MNTAMHADAKRIKYDKPLLQSGSLAPTHRTHEAGASPQ
jgi:hypothetical protein